MSKASSICVPNTSSTSNNKHTIQTADRFIFYGKRGDFPHAPAAGHRSLLVSHGPSWSAWLRSWSLYNRSSASDAIRLGRFDRWRICAFPFSVCVYLLLLLLVQSNGEHPNQQDEFSVTSTGECSDGHSFHSSTTSQRYFAVFLVTGGADHPLRTVRFLSEYASVIGSNSIQVLIGGMWTRAFYILGLS